MDTSLGGILRERRKAKNLTLRRLAEMSGVGNSQIGRIEKDERFPSAHVLRKLAKPLGFTEIELFKIAGFLSRDESDDKVDKWEYNTIDQRNYIKGPVTEDQIDEMLNSFGKDGWELVGWYGVWFIFKRNL